MAAGVDVNTQQSFEALNQRAVAVVVDPIQSVKGKVVIDAFRSINPQMTMMGYEPRQTTSIIGHLTSRPSKRSSTVSTGTTTRLRSATEKVSSRRKCS